MPALCASGAQAVQVEPLQRDEVHLWTIERDRRADLELLAQCLSSEERQRARRLRVADRRAAFIYNRAVVRQILASYAGIEPQQVPLAVSAAGKPFWDPAALGNDGTPSCLSFNLSHREDLAILAVAQRRALGVDVEAPDPRTDYAAVARQAMSAREMQLFQQLAADERPGALLRLWTRKEAYLKAQGTGLARSLAEIEVTFLPAEPPQLLATGDCRETASTWLLESWSPRPGWIAALATPREGVALHLRFHRTTSLRDWHTSLHDQEMAIEHRHAPDREEQQHVA